MEVPFGVALLAVVQGLTEFLPVSSSGHLVLVRALTGLKEAPLTLEVVLHLGTLGAVLVFFSRKIRAVLGSAWRGDGDGRRWLVAVVVGSIPAAGAGLLFREFFESAFGSLVGTGCCLIATGLGLWFLGKGGADRPGPAPGLGTAMAVGLAQAVAILPGISRSGSTLLAGLNLGLDRRTAGEFSFFLMIPAVAGAGLLDLLKAGSEPGLPAGLLLLGAALAGATGLLALGLLMWLLRGGRLRLFAPWCLAAGLVALWLGLSGPIT